MLKDKYIDYLTFEKRYSTHTLIAYRTDLEEYSCFLLSQYNIIDLLQSDHTFIRSWLISLLERKISTRSVNRKISTLKSFYRFCEKMGMLTTNPMNKVVSPQISKQLPVFLTNENIEKLFQSVDFGIGFKGSRDKLVVTLFYATGIRREELINIKVNDVSLENGTIKVLGKRKKERIVPIGTKVIGEIEKYLLLRADLIEQLKISNPNDSNSLFVTSKGLPVNPKLIYTIVHKYLTLVSSVSKLSPHILRHTFATHMLDDGADINAIKELLGHSSLAATQVYTHNTIEKLKSIYKQAHPRA
jgi:integrase/recombinase XerC